jgi:anti-anti-sigma regulatory factor
MLRLDRAANGDVVFTVIGRMHAENVGELENLIRSETPGRPIVLNLKDLTLVDREAVGFLAHCAASGIQLKNCSAYIREWIARERDECNRLPLSGACGAKR